MATRACNEPMCWAEPSSDRTQSSVAAACEPPLPPPSLPSEPLSPPLPTLGASESAENSTAQWHLEHGSGTSIHTSALPLAVACMNTHCRLCEQSHRSWGGPCVLTRSAPVAASIPASLWRDTGEEGAEFRRRCPLGTHWPEAGGAVGLKSACWGNLSQTCRSCVGSFASAPFSRWGCSGVAPGFLWEECATPGSKPGSPPCKDAPEQSFERGRSLWTGKPA